MHCWKDRKEHIEETHGFHSPEHLETYSDDWRNGTCMLEDGHDGEHEFTPDSQIGVTFAPAEEPN